MALLPILHFPDPRLRTKARPVDVVDGRIRRLAADMLETMYAAPGIGLAATQVNVHERVLVLDVTEDRSQPRVFINPEIISREGDEDLLDRETTVPADAPLVAFDTRKVPRELSAAVLFLLAEHVTARIERRGHERLHDVDAGVFNGRSMLIIDEAWKLVERRATG